MGEVQPGDSVTYRLCPDAHDVFAPSAATSLIGKGVPTRDADGTRYDATVTAAVLDDDGTIRVTLLVDQPTPEE